MEVEKTDDIDSFFNFFDPPKEPTRYDAKTLPGLEVEKTDDIDSFFNFFDPPKEPTGYDANYTLQKQLEHHYDLGDENTMVSVVFNAMILAGRMVPSHQPTVPPLQILESSYIFSAVTSLKVGECYFGFINQKGEDEKVKKKSPKNINPWKKKKRKRYSQVHHVDNIAAVEGDQAKWGRARGSRSFRRTFNNQVLHIIKDGDTFSTMHTLLTYLQIAAMDQLPLFAGDELMEDKGSVLRGVVTSTTRKEINYRINLATMEDPLDTPFLDRLRRNGALVSKNSFKSLPMGLTRTMRESKKLVYRERASKGKVLERSNKGSVLRALQMQRELQRFKEIETFIEPSYKEALSKYEDDFLYSLPKRTTIGLLSLSLSLAATMIAFSATLALVLPEKVTWIAAPLVAATSIPVCLFGLLQFPLLVELVYSTYERSIFHKQMMEGFIS
uniref:Ankyrin repeat-containing domain, PGG domain protein n=1 Tax=Tanacetum cinerariifolium TaxID=118510 RepID=A0A6L2P621_TANCI|nr:ankyrin repeat-containing domain, PGG domain protein [Tanacetum cinerariifolium]